MLIASCPCCGKQIVAFLDLKPASDEVKRPAPTKGPLPGQKRRPDGTLEPAPMDLERAAAFELPIGKYKGRTIADVAEKDINWLKWFAGTDRDGVVRRAVRFFLDNA